jgi:acylphosphatase
MFIQKKVVISGQVQGVGFRFFIQEHAERLGIKGYAKNTSKDAVEAVFQGDEKAIDEMITFCKKGPETARVDTIEELSSTEPSYHDFTIKT